MRRFIVLPIIVMMLINSALAEKRLINTDKNGVALKGYDPVAYFTDDKPVKGNPQFQAVYNGGTYYFASAYNKKLFEADPRKYEPQFGGFCATPSSRRIVCCTGSGTSSSGSGTATVFADIVPRPC